ncbi:MAG: 4'-phosphopantetheinyl transferase superfamily protein [Acidobacteriia bacterium]|nr:4'-phosphopantetheinyl transferase superfamily protein [Terriglobia bacterium]
MIVGLGIDLFDSSRVERELARGDWPREDGIFTQGEIAHCNSTARPARSYAACFAAKEATLKALDLRADDLGFFGEVEVEPVACGYRLTLHGRPKARAGQLGVRQAKLSIARHGRLIGAVVILED